MQSQRLGRGDPRTGGEGQGSQAKTCACNQGSWLNIRCNGMILFPHLGNKILTFYGNYIQLYFEFFSTTDLEEGDLKPFLNFRYTFQKIGEGSDPSVKNDTLFFLFLMKASLNVSILFVPI